MAEKVPNGTLGFINERALSRNKMDITTISTSTATRDRLAEFRDTRGFGNYDTALQAMLEEVDAET